MPYIHAMSFDSLVSRGMIPRKTGRPWLLGDAPHEDGHARRGDDDNRQ